MRRRHFPRGLSPLLLLPLAGCVADPAGLRREATSLRAEGRIGEATEAYGRLVASLSGEDRDVRQARADALRELGGMHASFGDAAVAERSYLAALAIAETAPRLREEFIINLRTQLASLSYAAGRGEEAVRRYEGVLTLERNSLGEDHPDVLATLGILAGLHMKCGRPDRAEPLLRRQLAMTERLHGPNRRETASTMDRLAEALSRLGREQEAGACRAKAAEIRKKLCDEC